LLFNTIDFVVFLIFVLTTIVIIKNRKFQHLFLVFSSYFFFYFSSNYLIVLLIFSTLLDFYVGKAIWKTTNVVHKKLLLIASLSGNLGLLGFFKYADFAILQFNILGNNFNFNSEIPFLNLALPIGISFYTFQTISYTVDVYRGKLAPTNSLPEFALFVAFFPQLVAGPILRASQFLPQLREKIEKIDFGHLRRLITIENYNLKLGISMVALGFFKKMFLADNIAPLVNDVFSSPIGEESFTIILGAIGFGIQIYMDFSGYSDIAIGVALMLGFKIPINFNKPYFASSPSDFWRRWHISLSTWLRDYLYIPLGGSKKSQSRTYLNLAIVMFLGGLWHGASWNFVIWGLLHGAYLAIHRLIINKFPFLKHHPFFKSSIGKIVSIFVTQYFIFLAWIPFRVHDFEQMQYSITKYIMIDFSTSKTIEFISLHKLEVALIILFFILYLPLYKRTNMLEKVANLKLGYWILFLTSIMLAILFFYDGDPEDFIYFRF